MIIRGGDIIKIRMYVQYIGLVVRRVPSTRGLELVFAKARPYVGFNFSVSQYVWMTGLGPTPQWHHYR